MIFDTVMGNAEFDMLELRIRTLENVPNLVHVVVEADVDHQDHPKPYHFSENQERFAQWGDRLRIVRAAGLPTFADDPDPWAREHAQREYAFEALSDAQPDDVVLHGDIDEIPRPSLLPTIGTPGWRGFRVLHQTLYCFAVDWLHPGYWRGTVCGHWRDIAGKIEFADMRSMRGFADMLPNAGWHFSWLGGQDAALKKLGSFCHPEIAGRTLDGLEADLFMREGFHVDGVKMLPVDVDDTFPQWIQDRECPASWFRPRDVQATGWTPPTGWRG